jgi:hypothetical protein
MRRTRQTSGPFKRRTLPTIACLLFVACASAPSRSYAAQSVAQTKSTPTQSVDKKLTEEERQLVRGSKEAVIGAGHSEGYFDEHFTLQSVFNRPGDRRVVWRFRVGGHEATLVDSIGSYTDASGRRVDAHSIGHALPNAHDIEKTITPRRARRIMRTCLGPFDGGAVVYGPGQQGSAALVFTASSKPVRGRGEREREEREREERERRERAARRGNKSAQTEPDALEEEDEGGSPVYIGAVDLETGRCTKGLALAGPPPPSVTTRGKRR